LIRLIYWLLAIIEVILLLIVLLIFMVTDSRTIKYIAQSSLEKSSLSYEKVEGNLFNGLKVTSLRYKHKPLFSSALIHWNPLTVLSKKVTITQIDVQGIELKNVMSMAKDFKSDNSENSMNLNLEVILKKSHFDIKPYVYEGVKFSSFKLDTGVIKLSKDLELNTGLIALKFNSDIANVKLKGKIKENQLLVKELKLKNISIKSITKLSHQLRKNSLSKKRKQKHTKNRPAIGFLKDIKIKHILGTLKPVEYGSFKIKNATLNLYNGVISPSKNFSYDVKKVKLNGQTNFGKVDYRAYIKDSNIYAKGDITLDKKLFDKYHLPLNFKALKTLKSSLHLNHQLVEVDIEHQLTNLLNIQSNFNLDISNAKHHLSYVYADGIVNVESNVSGSMSYADNFSLTNRVRIDKKGSFSYEGELNVEKIKGMPAFVSNYLAPSLQGTYKATADNFNMQFDSDLLSGELQMPEYKRADVSLKSKFKNIQLNQFVEALPLELADEEVGFTSQSSFDFDDITQSNIALNVSSNIVNIEANMNLEEPYAIHFLTTLLDESVLKMMMPKVNFDTIKNLQGTLTLDRHRYLLSAKNEQVKLFMSYNSLNKMLEEGSISIDNEQFTLNRDAQNNLVFQTDIANIQDFLEKIKMFYAIKVPNIQGQVNVQLQLHDDGSLWIHLQSPKLQYLSEGGVDLSVTNIYDIDTTFKIDNQLNIVNIEIQDYQFKLDDNGYLNAFYSHDLSHLTLRDNLLTIDKLGVNENIDITGTFNLDNLKGTLLVNATEYALSTKDFALLLNLALQVKIDKDKFNIEGNIEILGDTITYEMSNSNIVEDSDIIIVKDMLREKESMFNKLKLYVQIKSRKPLKYIAENISIEFMNNLSILKNYNQKMMITGTSTITKGYYLLEDKKIILDESHLYFTGDVKKPLLDIKANYEKDAYNVHIFISGTTDAPIINFNSEPYLSQQEILSLILFDGTGSSSGKGAEAYTLLGGLFAKGLIKSLGINIDHLLLGQDAQDELSIEIGKRVSKNVSVLYLHKDGKDGVKVQVEHSKSFETDIIIQPPNTSSIEFLYKQDR